MLFVVIFGFVIFFVLWGVLCFVKNRNIFGFLLVGVILFVFGWFIVMIVINSGYLIVY